MFKKRKEKQNEEFVNNIKTIWENDHGEEIAEAYNKIVDIIAILDTYSANMVVNLVQYQTVQKTFEATVGKKEKEVKK